MADFCRQCSIYMFGKDYGDLKGLSSEEDTKNELYAIALCEGCGLIQVDHEGNCVSPDCGIDHTKQHFNLNKVFDEWKVYLMRYVIYEKIVNKIHPYLKPGQTMFYLLDTFKKQLSLGCYTTRSKAEYWLGKVNH